MHIKKNEIKGPYALPYALPYTLCVKKIKSRGSNQVSICELGLRKCSHQRGDVM